VWSKTTPMPVFAIGVGWRFPSPTDFDAPPGAHGVWCSFLITAQRKPLYKVRFPMKKTDEFSKDEVVYPNFLYIGAPKAGSSWIFEVLREHPEVFVPVAKDIQFFDYNYEKGIDWYLSFFRPGIGKKAVGELSHDYLYYEEAATRIKGHLPDVLLLCCLREPVEETMSAFLQQRKEELSKDTTFEEYAFQEQTLKLCDYYYNLLPYYKLFPRENILVLFFDDLRSNPTLFAKRIFEFLGVDPDFVPRTLERRVLPASEPRSFWFAHMAYNMSLILRRLGFANLIGAVKRNRTFLRLVFKTTEKQSISPETKGRIREHYRERYRALPELIGQPLPERWLL
jgi:hypothetical protein